MGIDKDKSLLTAAAELRRHAEERLNAQAPEARPTRSEDETQRLIHELQVHQIELEMQNAELLQARDEVESALEKYTDLYDFAPVGYFTLDPNGTIRAVNLTGAGLLGVERTLLIGRRFGQFIADDARPAFTAFLQNVFESRAKDVCEVALLKKGPHPPIVQIEAVATVAGQECRVAVIDITERRWTDDKLRKSERQLAEAQRLAHLGSWQWDAIADEVTGSDEFYRIFGRNFSSYEGFLELVHPDDRDRVNKAVKDTLDRQSPYNIYYRIVQPGGTIRIIHAQGEAATNDAGTVIRMNGTAQDVTERKRMEERTVHLASFPQLNPNPILEMDSSGRITFFNPAAVKILETLGMDETDSAVFLPSDMEGILESWDRLNEVTLYREIVIKDRAFGETIFLTPQFNVARIYSCDITEHKQAEKALRDSEERVRLKLDSILSPVGDIGNLELADIIDAQAMQSLMDNFYKLTRMPMGMIDLTGKVLVGVGWQDVCTKFHRIHPETCKNCIESDTLLSAGVPPGKFKLYKCKNNMWDVATPIMVGGRQFGNFFMGQFFFEDEPLDYEFFRSQARQYGFDEKEYIASLERAPRLSRDSLDIGMAYFMELADMISRTSYSNLKLARSLAERDTLMDSLQKAHDELELRVEERTEELASTINHLKEEIAERERAEEKILRLNRLHAVLSETDQAIVRAADRDTLFHDFCRIAVENGGFLLSWIGVVDEETGQVTMAASHGATGYLDDIRISAREEPEGLGPTGISIREGTHYICNDFLGDPCTRPWHETGRAHGIGASAAIALKLHGKAIGALTLYADTKDFFDRQHVELLLQMGTEISFALDSLDREALRREAEQALQAETGKRLQAVEELRVREQMLMQQSRQAAMGEMIGNIAHQWRQPLNLLGLIIQELPMTYELDRLTRENLDASVQKATQVIHHMSQTIDDFRNFFRPDKEKVLFKANDIVAKTVSLIEGSFRDQRIKIEISARDDIFVFGYPNEYSQVILNILINSRDAFIERKTDEPRAVMITLSRENDKAVATIADNAGGIAAEIMEKIFDPYFTTKGPDKGTGVGLFMSKTIIEQNMSGRLSACNSGNGAEFRIEV